MRLKQVLLVLRPKLVVVVGFKKRCSWICGTEGYQLVVVQDRAVPSSDAPLAFDYIACRQCPYSDIPSSPRTQPCTRHWRGSSRLRTRSSTRTFRTYRSVCRRVNQSSRSCTWRNFEERHHFPSSSHHIDFGKPF